MTLRDEMTLKTDASEMRALSSEDIDSVSGGKVIRIPLGGQVDVLWDNKSGAWIVSLSGRAEYSYPNLF